MTTRERIEELKDALAFQRTMLEGAKREDEYEEAECWRILADRTMSEIEKLSRKLKHR